MIDLLGLNVLQKFVVSQLFLAVGLNELKVQLSLIFVTQPLMAQIRVCCQKEIQKMSKLGLEVMPSDDENHFWRLRVYTITGFPLLSLFSKPIQALFYSPTFDHLGLDDCTAVHCCVMKIFQQMTTEVNSKHFFNQFDYLFVLRRSGFILHWLSGRLVYKSLQ